MAAHWPHCMVVPEFDGVRVCGDCVIEELVGPTPAYSELYNSILYKLSLVAKHRPDEI